MEWMDDWEMMGYVVEHQFTVFCDRTTLESEEVSELLRRADSVVMQRDTDTGLIKVKGIITIEALDEAELEEREQELDSMIMAVKRAGADIFVL